MSGVVGLLTQTIFLFIDDLGSGLGTEEEHAENGCRVGMFMVVGRTGIVRVGYCILRYLIDLG
jgi:hypothetical protein